jgi:hypothetical protein
VALARAGHRAGARAEARWLASLSRPYLFGRHTYWRAAIAATLDDKDAAVQLLRTSFQQGQRSGFLHYDAHFAPLWGYEPFEDLIRPKG